MGQTATVGFRFSGQRQDNLLAVASTLALEEFAVNVLAEVLVKGGDYHVDSLAETAVVKAYDRRALAILGRGVFDDRAGAQDSRAGS